MKKYVSYFGPNPVHEPARSQFEDPEPYRVQYSSGPELKTHYTEAHFSCNELNTQIRPHVGSHYCEFSVEQLSEFEYAIVCLSHPDTSVSK
jgi:hypothetical protein